MKKRILVDGRFIGVGDSISRYVLEMLREILNLDKENRYTLLIRPQGKEKLESFFDAKLVSIETDVENQKDQFLHYCLDPNIHNLQIVVADIPHYSVSEQRDLLKYLNREKFDLVHFTQFNHPIFYRGDYVTTIHDLTLVGHLHYFNFIKQLAFKMVMRSAAKDSKKIIAISKTTMGEVIDYFSVPESKFEIIYHGLDFNRFNNKIKNVDSKVDDFKTKYKIDGEYILYTGMWKKHKNLLRMLKAYEQLILKNPDIKTKMVLVGKIDKNEPEVIELIKTINLNLQKINQSQFDSVVITGFIDEEELPVAYAGATLYCIPSLAEGFGWPPLEAMACGTPVISSKISCMPEILGDAAYYFDPYNIANIANSMKKIITDKDKRAELLVKGLEHVKKYDWKDCASKTLDAYNTVLNKE